MREFHVKRGKEICPTLNLDKLWHAAGGDAALEQAKAAKKGSAVVIDLNQLGYFKLLGKGNIPQVPVIVKVRYVSEEAEKKVKAAGGAVQLTA
jgi:large subunit ribosomal protein L27Ae